ncbi:hypothetical protein Hdeb2414_s0397g00885601 [Helianthus debilis subsp. tardiflorus]
MFSNLRYLFSIFVLNVLEYYRVSFGQLHPQGVSRVLHFEVLCRALGYNPTLLMFRRFFRQKWCLVHIWFLEGNISTFQRVKGFTKVSSSKPSTRRSSRRLKGPSQSSANDPVDLSDDIEVSEDQGVEVEVKKDKDLIVVVGKKGKIRG